MTWESTDRNLAFVIEKIKNYPFLLKNNVIFILLFLAFFIVSNFIFRLTFFFYNIDSSLNASLNDILYSFLMGIRFDLAVFSILNFFPVLVLLLPLKYVQIHKRFHAALWIMLLLAVPVYFLNGMDIAYFAYSGKRTTFELLVLKKDVFSFSPMLILQYFWLFFIFSALIAVTYLLLRYWFIRLKSGGFTVQRRVADFILFPAALVLLFIGMRGGLQLRALRPAMAFFSPSFFLGHVASNTAFNIIKSLSSDGSDKLAYLDEKASVQTVRNLISGKHDGPFLSEKYPFVRKTSYGETPPKYNVVLIVMESMNAENVGRLDKNALAKNLTPNFDRLADAGLLFTNYHSNAKRSIEAFPAILNSLPDILPNPIVTSEYETNATWGMGNILKSRGYRTAFFHGGRNGSMGLDQYASISGFEKYYGLNEYSSAHGMDRFDGHWGIFDDAFFDYFYETLSSMQQPYFTAIFTLSNHHPYDLPETGWEWLKKSNLSDPEKGVRYADEALGKFFEKAKTLPNYNKTIFIITSDHYTFNSLKPGRDIMTMYHIPLLIYAPGIIKPGLDNRMANHLNLLPTLIDMLKINTHHAGAGKSLLEQPGGTFTFLQSNGLFTYARDGEALVTDFDKFKVYYTKKNKKWIEFRNLPEDKKGELYSESLSFYQSYHNSIVTNTITAQEFMQAE